MQDSDWKSLLLQLSLSEVVMVSSQWASEEQFPLGNAVSSVTVIYNLARYGSVILLFCERS